MGTDSLNMLRLVMTHLAVLTIHTSKTLLSRAKKQYHALWSIIRSYQLCDNIEVSRQRRCLKQMAHVIVVTQARVVCLICTPEARGPQAQGLRVDISGRPRVPVLQLLCNTSFPCKWLHYIYSSTYCFRLWVRIMTFILRF